MKKSSRSLNIAIALFLIIAAAILRLYGIGWGLPQVYEEATPLHKAWEMWGWGTGDHLDFNPHFFNYPSLSMYIQFIGQALLYIFMKLFGAVDSTLDYRIHYVLDKTPFYLMGRSITALFGVLTVWLTYMLGRKFMGQAIAALAAFFLAINPFHISKSQVVEVDVPMTCLILLTLFFTLRLLENPVKKNYFITGLTMGLAASMKYTAALLVIPLLVAHIISRRNKARNHNSQSPATKQKPPWMFFALALALTLLAFFATSPFVFLDVSTFLKDFSFERQHMQLGHFGLDATPTWLFYMQSLTGNILGWPLTVFALFGLIYLTVFRRRVWALALASFVIPFLFAITSWTMKADRYLLPVLPVLLLFASGTFAESLGLLKLSRVPRKWKMTMVTAGVLILSIPLLAAYPDHLNRLKPDTRTVAKEWIEAHISPGSFILAEHFGPDLFDAKKLIKLKSDVRREIFNRKTNTPVYAVQLLPIVHNPKHSEVYYDVSLYEDADFVVISDAVRSRYLKEPARFPIHVAFYDSLESQFQKVREFLPEEKTGPTVIIYKNPLNNIPFYKRRIVMGPSILKPSPERVYRAEEFFYENLGFNYEAFGYIKEALTCFELAFRYPITRPTIRTNMILGKTRCLIALERREEAAEFLGKMIQVSKSQADRTRFTRFRERILSRLKNN